MQRDWKNGHIVSNCICRNAESLFCPSDGVGCREISPWSRQLPSSPPLVLRAVRGTIWNWVNRDWPNRNPPVISERSNWVMLNRNIFEAFKNKVTTCFNFPMDAGSWLQFKWEHLLHFVMELLNRLTILWSREAKGVTPIPPATKMQWG